MASPKIALLTTAYFPPIPYMATVVNTPSVWIESYEHFRKGSYRNRCHIATSHGLHVLSIPLKKGKNNQQVIRDVRIAYDVDWQKQHWQSLKTAYGSAPFWLYYAPYFEPFFQKPYPFLFDFNLSILQVLLKILKWENRVSLSFTTTYEAHYTEGSDFRQSFSPKQTSAASSRYPQVFSDRHAFLPGLSILDLLFCCGNQSLAILQTTGAAIH
jgi:hypothetical protein